MKAKMVIKILLAVTITITSFGCASKPMYYWGNYSDSLYHAKKDPGVESLAKHKESLENILDESNKRNLRIPPGVCAELGYLYATQNNTKQAIEYFQMEKLTYPESTNLMDSLIMQAKNRTSDGGSLNEKFLNKDIETEKSIGGGKN